MTADRDKPDRYAADGHFREGWIDLLEATGGEAGFAIERVTAVVLKPETLAARKTGQVIAMLAEAGFIAVHCHAIEFDGAAVQAAWRYQMDRASDDRIRLRSFGYSSTTALYLLLQAVPAPISAATRLCAIKGSPHPDRGRPGDLRARLAPPNAVLSFLHAPDDFADFVRESAIWMSPADRLAIQLLLIDEAATERVSEATELALTIEGATQPYQFAPADARQELVASVTAVRERDPAAAAALLAMLEQAGRDAPSLDLRSFEAALTRLGLPVRSWACFMFASEHISLSAPPRRCCTADVEVVRIAGAMPNGKRRLSSVAALSTIGAPDFCEARDAWAGVLRELACRYGRAEELPHVLEVLSHSRMPAVKSSAARVLVGVSGPGAAGKDAILAAADSWGASVSRPVYVTTRRPRAGEVDGRDYRFVDAEAFAALEAQGAFAVVRTIAGRGRYGLPRSAVFAAAAPLTLIREAPTTLHDLGSKFVRARPDADFAIVYVLPPQPMFETLQQRAIARDCEGGVPSMLDSTLRAANATNFASAVHLMEDGAPIRFIVNDDLGRAQAAFLDVLGSWQALVQASTDPISISSVSLVDGAA